MSDRQIARDLERKIVTGLQEYMEREFAIARLVLEPAELGVILSTMAVGQVTTAAATLAGMANEQTDPEAFFDSIIDEIARVAHAKKGEAFETIRAHQARMSGAAR